MIGVTIDFLLFLMVSNDFLQGTDFNSSFGH